MTVSAPPRPPSQAPEARDSKPLEREEIEALVEALIEEARRETRRRHRRYWALAAFVALVGVVVLILLGGGAASQRASPALSARSSVPAQAVKSKIAFIREPGGGYAGVLYVMSPDGSGQQMLAPAFPGMRWSPDGQKIAFSTWTDQSSSRGSDGKSDLYVMNADGSGKQRLTNDPSTWDEGPTWSPDGRALAFTSGNDFYSRDIYVINVDGSERRRLTGGAVTLAAGVLAWSPLGDKIAFARERDGDFGIYVINADGSGQRRLTRNAPGSYVPAWSPDDAPAWSPDGRRIAFESNWQIWVMNADGSGQRRLTRKGAHNSNLARSSNPAWSPDGKRIAFEREGDPCSWCQGARRFDVYVMNADGSGEQRLTRGGGSQPGWSPDGRKIVFVRQSRSPRGQEARSDIFVMNADGTGQRNLTRTPDVGRRESHAVWSPALSK